MAQSNAVRVKPGISFIIPIKLWRIKPRPALANFQERKCPRDPKVQHFWTLVRWKSLPVEERKKFEDMARVSTTAHTTLKASLPMKSQSFMVVELMENDIGEMMGMRFEECDVELKGKTLGFDVMYEEVGVINGVIPLNALSLYINETHTAGDEF
ncbi:hypothetical protein Acr_05g0011910 [Actinidia rufa]|uniref:Uncharacterized protein n=1 Tax=Actinidia rufa TaxID=165716 RepID=A0A7J0EML6_9ERIC|nr:hypothetical protein Acr_05g0011910 [Actinidia rufa]